jgi:hypothetical protein
MFSLLLFGQGVVPSKGASSAPSLPTHFTHAEFMTWIKAKELQEKKDGDK